MGKCEVCGVEAKWFLFKPSDVAVFLCMTHVNLHRKHGSPPIVSWVKKEKRIFDFMKGINWEMVKDGNEKI